LPFASGYSKIPIYENINKFIMIITFPLSYTISFILDKLGEKIGIVYDREKLIKVSFSFFYSIQFSIQYHCEL
jgi:hypothetical protein